jgi:hypothetical protein
MTLPAVFPSVIANANASGLQQIVQPLTGPLDLLLGRTGVDRLIEDRDLAIHQLAAHFLFKLLFEVPAHAELIRPSLLHPQLFSQPK